MDEPTTTTATEVDAAPAHDEQVDHIAEDVLVEEVSIDGMCGVY